MRMLQCVRWRLCVSPYVCAVRALTFDSLVLVETSFWYAGTDQVYLTKSSGKGQGHGRKTPRYASVTIYMRMRVVVRRRLKGDNVTVN